MNESSGSTVIDSIAGNNITIGGSPSRVSTSYGTYTGYALSIQNATQYGYITLPANMVVGAHSITSWVYFTGFPPSGSGNNWLGWGASCKGDTHSASYTDLLSSKSGSNGTLNVAPNTGSPYYVSGVAVGGTQALSGNGGPGLVILIYTA